LLEHTPNFEDSHYLLCIQVGIPDKAILLDIQVDMSIGHYYIGHFDRMVRDCKDLRIEVFQLEFIQFGNKRFEKVKGKFSYWE